MWVKALRTAMTSAQNWPKTALSSLQSPSELDKTQPTAVLGVWSVGIKEGMVYIVCKPR